MGADLWTCPYQLTAYGKSETVHTIATRHREREREQSDKTQPSLPARHCPGLNVLLWLQHSAAVQTRPWQRARRPSLPCTGTGRDVRAESEQHETIPTRTPGETYGCEEKAACRRRLCSSSVCVPLTTGCCCYKPHRPLCAADFTH